MFAELYQKHQAEQANQKATLAKKKQQMIDALNALTNSLSNQLNRDASKAYANQRHLNEDMKQLHRRVRAHNTHLSSWLRLIGDFSKALKELGDAANWTRKMERELFVVDGCLRLALKHSATSPSC